jgi:hypothetical protein
LLKENFRDELKKDGEFTRWRALCPIAHSSSDWKLVVKLKGLLNIPGP